MLQGLRFLSADSRPAETQTGGTCIICGTTLCWSAPVLQFHDFSQTHLCWDGWSLCSRGRVHAPVLLSEQCNFQNLFWHQSVPVFTPVRHKAAAHTHRTSKQSQLHILYIHFSSFTYELWLFSTQFTNECASKSSVVLVERWMDGWLLILMSTSARWMDHQTAARIVGVFPLILNVRSMLHIYAQLHV